MKYKFNDIEIESVKQINEDTPIMCIGNKVVTAKEMATEGNCFEMVYVSKDGNNSYVQTATFGDYMVNLKSGESFMMPKNVFELLVKEVE